MSAIPEATAPASVHACSPEFFRPEPAPFGCGSAPSCGAVLHSTPAAPAAPEPVAPKAPSAPAEEKPVREHWMARLSNHLPGPLGMIFSVFASAVLMSGYYSPKD